jgi:hypothetical protein
MSSLSFHTPKNVQRNSQYNATIAFSLLETIKHLGLSVADGNELAHSLLKGKSSMDEATCDAWIASFNSKMEVITGRKARMIENRPKPGRNQGFCYRNAVLEHEETGNEVVIGLEALCIGDAMIVVPHAYNYDKKKNIHYDTALTKRGDANRRVYPKLEGKEALDMLVSNEAFSTSVDFNLLWGGYIFVGYKKQSFRIKTWGCNVDRNRSYILEASETIV